MTKRTGEAGIHPASGEWFIKNTLPDEGQILENMYNNKDELTALWKTFFDSIAIKERITQALQQKHASASFQKTYVRISWVQNKSTIQQLREEQRGQY